MKTYKSDRAMRIGVGLVRRYEAIVEEQRQILLKTPKWASIAHGHLNAAGQDVLAGRPLVKKWRDIARACKARLLMTRVEAVYAGNKSRVDYLEKEIVAPLVAEANAYSIHLRSPQTLVARMDSAISPEAFPY